MILLFFKIKQIKLFILLVLIIRKNDLILRCVTKCFEQRLKRNEVNIITDLKAYKE